MNPAQAALVEKARESIRAARLLASQGMPDFSVSRSYYAMFYLAEAILLEDGLAFSKHVGVIAAFGQHFAKTGRVAAEYHRFLIEAQSARQTADYGTGPGISEATAAEQIQRAYDFLRLTEGLLIKP